MKKQKIQLLAVIFLLPFSYAWAACDKPMVFFDLGQTLVDTETNNYKPMFYLEPDSRKFSDAVEFSTSKHYIDALVAKKFSLGLIIDIPGDWGINYPVEAPVRDLSTAKIIRTMDFLQGLVPEDEASWTGTLMDWKPFVQIHGIGIDRTFTGNFLAAQIDVERKSKGSLVLFQRAKQIASALGCAAVYQGESEKEMILAELAGLVPFWVGHTMPGVFFLPPDRIINYAKDYKAGDWKTH